MTKDPATKDPATKDPATKDPAKDPTTDPATKDPATDPTANAAIDGGAAVADPTAPDPTTDPAKDPAKDPATKDPATKNPATKSPGAATKNEGPPKDLQILPKKWSRKQVTDYMKKHMERGLGVKCEFCHVKDDYAADHKRKKVARDMMKMTNQLNKEFFGGKSEISCFTCHQGKKEP